jgi:hypothetical protein
MNTKKVILFSIIIILLLLLILIVTFHYIENTNKPKINDVRNIGVTNEYVLICYTDINSCEEREIRSVIK